jgi:putative flippase GtrA
VNSYLKTFLNREAASQFVKVGAIGFLNTVVDFSLFNVLRVGGVPRNWAITVAFAVATFVSYLLNRRWSFQLTDGHVSLRETINFYVINVIAWLVTIGIVEMADWLFGPLSLLGENVAKFAAVVVILLPKFAGYRDIVFRKALTAEGRDPVTSPTGDESD